MTITGIPGGSAPTPGTRPPTEEEAVGGRPRPRVTGLDLSLTGSAIASSLGWCELVGVTGITTLDLPARVDALHALRDRILDLVGEPDLVVAEAIAYSRTNGGAAERAWLWHEVLGRLIRRGVEVATVTTGTLKIYATGSGQKKGASTKGAVIDAVARRWPAYETGGDDNLCDAVVLTAMGSDHLGHPLAPMPKTHRAALATVWPEVAR